MNLVVKNRNQKCPPTPLSDLFKGPKGSWEPRNTSPAGGTSEHQQGQASSILGIAGAPGAGWGEEEDGHHTWGALGKGCAS